MKKAIITGCLGQDGSYLAEHLLKLGYEVWGTARVNPNVHENYIKGVHYEYADLTDQLSLVKIIQKVNPDEIYNLAGQVFVPTSWISPADTFNVNVGGLARILDILERMEMHETRVYQASTSEMYGNIMDDTETIALTEDHPMNPVSPYGVSKLAAHKLVQAYRKRGMFVASGILFNHESPRRGYEMVTRKITRHVAEWMMGSKDELRLGNGSSKRDWGFAGDYVKAMHLMLQQDEPDDFVIGTGQAHSVEEFVNTAIDVGYVNHIGPKVKYGCNQFGRTPELHTLLANWSKAKEKLGWQPQYTFSDLVTLMVNEDYRRLSIRENVNV